MATNRDQCQKKIKNTPELHILVESKTYSIFQSDFLGSPISILICHSSSAKRRKIINTSNISISCPIYSVLKMLNLWNGNCKWFFDNFD